MGSGGTTAPCGKSQKLSILYYLQSLCPVSKRGAERFFGVLIGAEDPGFRIAGKLRAHLGDRRASPLGDRAGSVRLPRPQFAEGVAQAMRIELRNRKRADAAFGAADAACQVRTRPSGALPVGSQRVAQLDAQPAARGP